MKPNKIIPDTPGIPSPERRGWLADLADVCNSELAQGVATALVILAVLLGIGGCWHLEKTGDAQLEKAKAKE